MVIVSEFSCICNNLKTGADPGEVKYVNFPPPPFSESPSFFLFSYPSNIEMIFDFSDIITKFTPHFKILDPPLLQVATLVILNLIISQLVS